MSFNVLPPDGLEWEERPGNRQAVDVTTAGGLTQSRARLWRLPPGTKGRRHVEHAQEEVFVVLSGTLTLALGEPPELVEAPQGTVVTVAIGTPLQQRNEGGEECVVFAYGAPPVAGEAELLD